MRIASLACIVLAVASFLGCVAVHAADPGVPGLTAEQLKQVEQVVGKAMAAYNAGDDSAQFAKGKATLSVNFFKEGGVYKI